MVLKGIIYNIIKCNNYQSKRAFTFITHDSLRHFQSVWKGCYWWCNIQLIIINLSQRQGQDTLIHNTENAAGLISSSGYIVQNMNITAHTHKQYFDRMRCEFSIINVHFLFLRVWIWQSRVIKILSSVGFIRAVPGVLESLSIFFFLPPYSLNTFKGIPRQLCGKILQFALLKILQGCKKMRVNTIMTRVDDTERSVSKTTFSAHRNDCFLFKWDCHYSTELKTTHFKGGLLFWGTWATTNG